jgi:hydrogenase maturation protein HypF
MEIRGAVQGVGFRPHVYRLAGELQLDGWVVNDTRGVRLEVEGSRHTVERFARRLREDPPPRAIVHDCTEEWLAPSGLGPFEIRGSDSGGELSAVILPDLAPCPRCRAEVRDEGDRRHGYPFTNCTDCGPRLSIVRALPYDRPNTSMAAFVQCPACAREYGDPGDRRFHAQPNACPACGPHLVLLDGHGDPLSPASGAGGDHAIVDAAVGELGRGRIVALKGVGGFQLLVDATDEAAVQRLRRRKGRPHKPLALLVADVAEARRLCHVDADEARLLTSQEAPIVLLERRGAGRSRTRNAGGPEADAGGGARRLAPAVAPDTSELGIMLPASPLHQIVVERFGRPLVATSGNRSDEPICTGTDEAVTRLAGIADRYLAHDRPIVRHVDDAVVRRSRGATRLLRRARGYAPLPITTKHEVPPLLAVGGHLKNAVAVSRGRQITVGQHIGDLSTPEARDAFRRAVDDLVRMYRIEPEAVVHDSHPDYASSELARRWGGPLMQRIAVQHHHAHLASVLAEHGRILDERQVLGVTFDGTGYGPDGTIWGGEFLLGTAAGSERVAHLRTFTLPGGEAAVREPRRTALGLLHEAGLVERGAALGVLGDLASRELTLIRRAMERGVNAPETSSAGRLFDGVAALLGMGRVVSHEGQAAGLLEHACHPGEACAYPFEVRAAAAEPLHGRAPRVVDWVPMLHAVLDDVARGVPRERIAARFHNGLASAVARIAAWVGVHDVALTGGCFVNRVLLDRAADALERQGHRVLLNRQVPPGDGGICLGQVAVGAATLALESTPPAGV